MAAIATLKAVLGIDTKQYKAGMRDSTRRTQQFQKSLASAGRMMAGAFTVGAIVSATKSIVNFASEIRHTSDNLEINAETLQALNATALKYGMSIESLGKSLAKLRQSQGKVIEGDAEYQDAVEALNIDLEAFKKASPAQALELLARAYAGAKDRALAFSSVSDLMGRGAKQATAFMKELAREGLGGIEDAARSAGEVIDDEMITKLEKFGTRMEQIQLRLKVKAIGAVENVSSPGWREKVARFFGSRDAEIERWKKTPGGSPFLPDDVPDGDSGTPDKFDQKQISKVKKANAKLRRARLDGLERLKAEFDAKMDEVMGQIRLSPQANQELRRALFDQGEILQSAYDADVAAFKAAEQEKIDAVNNRYADQIAQLRARGISATGEGERTGGLASVGGMIGPSRPGLGASDRQLKLAIEANRMWQEANKLSREHSETLRNIEANTQPSGQP